MSEILLEVEGLDKRFGGLHAVKNVNMTIARGEIVGILGPNGAGKTTMFNLLTNFIAPDAGKVVFNGQSLRGVKPHKIVTLGVARTFQLCRPFVGLSVLENVLVGSLGPRVHHPDLGERACSYCRRLVSPPKQIPLPSCSLMVICDDWKSLARWPQSLNY